MADFDFSSPTGSTQPTRAILPTRVRASTAPSSYRALAARVEADSRIALVKLTEGKAKRRIGLVHRRTSPRLADLQALSAIIRRYAPDCVTTAGNDTD